MEEDRLLRLQEVLARQHSVRKNFYRTHDVNEIRAMRAYAYQLFGTRGLLEANPSEPGWVYLGCWEKDDRETPGQNRRRQLYAKANTIAEMVEQVETLRKLGLIT